MRSVLEVIFWIVAVIMISMLIVSLDYSFLQALLLSLAFVPASIALRISIPKISFKSRREGILNSCYLAMALLCCVTLLVIIMNVQFSVATGYFDLDKLEPIMVNPLFVGMIIMIFALIDYLFGRYLDTHLSEQSHPIVFTSNYKKVSIERKDILYIESRDTEVVLVTSEGNQYKNGTSISQWENLLGNEFVRIHRSYLVNRRGITVIGTDKVELGFIELPVSRKYRNTF